MEDLLGEHEEDKMNGSKVLTPRRSEAVEKVVERGSSVVGRKEGSETGDESDGWGW
jgi:hypothetical protein